MQSLVLKLNGKIGIELDGPSTVKAVGGTEYHLFRSITESPILNKVGDEFNDCNDQPPEGEEIRTRSHFSDVGINQRRNKISEQ